MPYKLKPIESLEDLAVPEEGGDIAATRHAAIALAHAAEPVGPHLELKARLLASVGRQGAYGVFADRVARMFDLPVDEAHALLRKIEEPSSWGPGVVEGMDLIPVMTGPKYAGSIATFAKFRPGTQFPRHVHVGTEVTLVMAGAFRDSTGIDVERGDELFEANGAEHDFKALDGEDCIAAAIVHGYIDLK